MKNFLSKFLKYIIAALIIGVGAFIVMKKDKEEVLQVVHDKAPINITTVKVKQDSFNIYEDAIGIIYNLKANEIASEVAARVEAVNVSLGDYVKKNRVIAELDPSEYINNANAQKAEIKRITAILVEQKITLSRYQKLIKKGFISKEDLDIATSNVQSSQASLKNAQAILANNRIKIKKSKIITDTSGIVQDVFVAKGDFVSIGTSMFDVVNNSNLIVIIGLPEFFLPKLHKGSIVLLQIPATTKYIRAYIKEIKPLIEEDSRSLQIVIDLDNRELNLKPGGTLSARVLIGQKENALLLPEEAIVERIAGKVVYVVNADGNTVIEKPVQVGVNNYGEVEIISGISANDVVALIGAGFLSDQAKVITNDNSN